MLVEELVRFSRLKNGDFPDTTTNIITLSLLDWASVGLAGVSEPVSDLILKHIDPLQGSNGPASVFGTKNRYDPRSAALANGTISHALDYDDTHFAHIGRLSTVVFPAVLAIGQAQGSSIADFKAAAIVGFESACRIGVWLGRAHYGVGFHQTATAGCLGATLACARLIGLDERQTRYALGLASSRASGLKSQFGSMGKPLNAGFAAASAIEAVQLAYLGMTSSPDPLEGQNGFGVTHAAECNLDQALEGLGSTFLSDENQYKFHACCHGLHATLEALRQLEDFPDPTDVREICIRTNPQWMTVCDIENPKTALEAKFSYRMVAALTLLGYDTGRLDVYSDALCDDAKVCNLMARVSVIADEDVAELGGDVTLVTSEAETHLTANLMKPLPFEEKKARLMAKSSGLIGEERADRLWLMCADSNDHLVDAISNVMCERI